MKKELEEEYVIYTIHWYVKANNTYIKEYDKNNESSYLKYLDVNNLYGWALSQKLPVNRFEWIEETSQFDEDFLTNYNNESDKGYLMLIWSWCSVPRKITWTSWWLIIFTIKIENIKSRKTF